MEPFGQLLPLRWGQVHACPLTQPLHRAAGHTRQNLELAPQRLTRSVRLARRRPPPLLACLHNQQRVRENQRARLCAPRSVSRHQLAHLTAREPPSRDRLDEPLALPTVGARQGNQRLHRGVRDNLPAKHRLLDRLGQIPHQREAPTHPAHAAVEPAGQILQRHGEPVLQLLQPQTLLEGALLAGCADQPPQKQGLQFRELPAGGLQRVLPESAHRPDALVAVHDNEPVGLGHHHDRHLLSVLCQGRQQPPLPLRAPNPKMLVAQDELVMLEVHRPHTACWMGWVVPLPGC